MELLIRLFEILIIVDKSLMSRNDPSVLYSRQISLTRSFFLACKSSQSSRRDAPVPSMKRCLRFLDSPSGLTSATT